MSSLSRGDTSRPSSEALSSRVDSQVLVKSLQFEPVQSETTLGRLQLEDRRKAQAQRSGWLSAGQSGSAGEIQALSDTFEDE
mmetsp:Transcript_14305/g.21365  ORF Transcript_14305/g.21365 Transcript_14305/m.21365 type:complete len:82 (-) Transcript_14305:354-599(-)